MRAKRSWGVALLCFILAGCGGGGGVNSTPPPTATPSPSPTPPNTMVTDLHRDEAFAVDSVTDDVQFNIDGRFSYDGTSGTDRLTISYDAESNSYTLSKAAATQSFAPSDREPADLSGRTYYVVTTGDRRDVLLLGHQAGDDLAPTRYVGFGYWQRDLIEGDIQNAAFDFFVYGFPSPASALPRTGFASWEIGLYGVSTIGGWAPMIHSGSGQFNVDFQTANFTARANLVIRDAATDKIVEDAGSFIAEGMVSGNGNFSGQALLLGASEPLAGPIEGAFYGPEAEELGATIIGAGDRVGSGADMHKVFVGALIGTRTDTANPVSQTLVNIVSDVASSSGVAEFSSGSSPFPVPSSGASVYLDPVETQQVTITPAADLILSSSAPWGLTATFSSQDQIAQTDRFTTFRKTIDDHETTLELFRPGPANTELALTYLSFGSWSFETTDGYGGLQFNQRYFTYGFPTPASLLMSRTGSAHYAGIVQATGSWGDGDHFGVGGTSAFDVDFTQETYSGALNLDRLAPEGGVAATLGQWTFSDRLQGGMLANAGLVGPDDHPIAGELQPRFFGPNGQEIGALFSIAPISADTPGAVWISGVTVAREN